MRGAVALGALQPLLRCRTCPCRDGQAALGLSGGPLLCCFVRGISGVRPKGELLTNSHAVNVLVGQQK